MSIADELVDPKIALKELIRAFREAQVADKRAEVADERFQQAVNDARFKETRESVREALAAIAVFLHREHGMSIETANLFISEMLSVSV